MLNSIGLANPGIEAFLADHLPRLRRARRPGLGLGRRLRGGRLRGGDRAPRRHGRRSPRGAQPVLPERGRGSRERRGRSWARPGAVTGKPLYAKLSPAVPDVAATRAGRRGGGRRRALPREHDPRPRARRAHAAPDSGARLRRPLRTGSQADRPRRRLRVPPRDRAAHRRDGRSGQREACARAPRGRRERRRDRHRRCSPTPAPRAASAPSWRPSWRLSGVATPDNVSGAAHEPGGATLDRESRVEPTKYLHTGANMVG